MLETLIWAAVVLALGMTVVLRLLPPLRRAVESWTSAHVVTSAERDAAVQETLTGIAERRHRLALSQALLAEETEAERARISGDTARYETDAEAARVCLEPAVAARQRALEARAEAEAALAPELARKALAGGDMEHLVEAYKTYCENCVGTPWSFEAWIRGFRGLR